MDPNGSSGDGWLEGLWVVVHWSSSWLLLLSAKVTCDCLGDGVGGRNTGGVLCLTGEAGWMTPSTA